MAVDEKDFKFEDVKMVEVGGMQVIRQGVQLRNHNSPSEGLKSLCEGKRILVKPNTPF